MDSTLWEAVSAVAAVVAVIGGGVSWWKANVSRAARDGAEAERERAERQAKSAETQAKAAREQADLAARKVAHLEGLLEESRSQSTSLERIADASSPRDLEVQWDRGILYRLRNNTAADMVLEQVDNRREFVRLDYLDEGVEIPAGGVVEFRAMGAAQRRMPSRLVLGMVGEDGPRVVEIPPKPRN